MSAAPPTEAAIAFTPADFDLSGGVAGRRSASAGFLGAFVQHAGLKSFTCLVPSEADADAFRALVARHGGADRPIEALLTPDIARVAGRGTLYTPGPDLSHFAWLRRNGDQRAFSLVGVTHTLSDARAMDAVGKLLTAPVQAWDALVCTTTVAKQAVERLLDAYGDYFAALTGSKLPSRVRLPVIPLGVDCDAFAPVSGESDAFRARLGIGRDDIVLLSMGRLDPVEKANPMPLYSAAEQAAARTGRRMHLLEVGWFRSELFAASFRQAAEILAPSVNRIVLDSREDANRRAWFAADIFVSLADNIQETFGLTPIEAMAAGLPVVVSDWNGYRDTVRDGIDGFRIPSLAPAAGCGGALAFDYASGAANHSMFCGAASQSTAIDSRACADALVHLIEDPALRRRLGAAGRMRACTTFDWRVVIAAYQQLWRDLAEIRRSAGEVASVGPAAPPNPLAMDPFDLFAAWPSAVMRPETVLALTAGADPLLASAMRRLWLAAPVPANLLDEASTGRLVERLRHGPATAGDLVATCGPGLEAAAWRSLGWLAKTGLLSWR